MIAARQVVVDGVPRALTGATVREVIPLPEVTPVPGAAPPIAGLAQVRGRITPILDPSSAPPAATLALPELPALPDEDDAHPTEGFLVLVDCDGLRLGLRVDALLDGGADEAAPLDLGRLLRALLGHDPSSPDSSPLNVPSGTATAAADSSAFAFTASDLSELRALFLDEADDHIDASQRAVHALERDPRDPRAHAHLMRHLHTLKGAAGSVGLDPIVTRVHQLEASALALRGTTSAAALDALAEAIDHLRAELSRIRRAEPQGPAHAAAPTPPIDDAAHVRVAVEHVDALMEAASSLVIDRARIARRLPDLESAARRLALARENLAVATGASIRDAANALLDDAQQRLKDAIHALLVDVEGLGTTSQVLQRGLQAMRMMEAGRLFSQLAGPTRELARRLGREVEIRTVGAATFIDKAVAERLAESLLHLSRNALAHGIEPPDLRVAAGKPRAGHIELSARQRGDEVLLEIADDGAGVDLPAVRSALVRAGRVTAAEADSLSEAQLLESIFASGISTREEAGDLAGRGVGLDAVRSAITLLGGTIRCASVAGAGTRFTIRLPLTAAIVRALLFKVGGHVYAVPAANVVHSSGEPRLPSPLPSMDLAALLVANTPPELRPRARHDVLLDHDGARFTVRVDRLIGEREIVVKGLGRLFADLPLYAGATVSGAGKVQLLLDVAELAARATTPTSAG